MKVDAEARPEPAAGASYVVRGAGRDGAPETDDTYHPPGLTKYEIALSETPDADPAAAVKYVKTALSAKGMFEAPNPAKADMDVTYSYEIKQRRRLREWDEPVYRRQGGGSRQLEQVEVGTDAGGNPVYSQVNTAPPSEMVVDMIHHSADEIVYVKELHLVATERKPATPDTPARVWDISISYEDPDPSMDKSMPLLAGAGCDLIGTNTNGPVVVRLHDKDEVVAFIKRGK